MAKPEAVAESVRVGEELRAKRLELGVTLEEVESTLKINRRYLAALEEGRGQELPGMAYALGFVRSYATSLGLDADDLARRYRDSAPAARRPVARQPEPEPEPRRAGGKGWLALVLLLGAGAAGWWAWSDGMIPLGGEGPATPPPSEVVVAAPRPPVAAAPRAPVAEPSATPAQPSPAEPATRPALPGVPPEPPEAPSRVSLRLSDETWVQVRDPATGQTILNRVFRANESFAIPREGLVLTTGKAQAVEVLVDGRPTRALAGRTGLVRDLPLVAEQLRQARPASPAGR